MRLLVFAKRLKFSIASGKYIPGQAILFNNIHRTFRYKMIFLRETAAVPDDSGGRGKGLNVLLAPPDGRPGKGIGFHRPEDYSGFCADKFMPAESSSYMTMAWQI